MKPAGQAPPNSKRMLMAVMIALTVILGLGALMTQGTAPSAMTRAVYPLIAAAALAAALALGLRCLALLRVVLADPWERLIFGAGVGLGIFALATLGLGLLGALTGWLMWGLLALTFVSGWGHVSELWRDIAARFRATRLSPATVFWLVIGVFFVMNLTAAFMPPHLYDALEYHLAAPAAFHRAGHIYFLADNVYANFPENVEMLYLLGMSLAGARDGGVIVAKLIVCVIGLLTAVGARALARRFFHEHAGDAAAAIFYLWPGVTAYSAIEYVELPLIFYGTLAILAAAAIADGGLKQWGRLVILAGVCAGFAVGCKYTAALLLVIPLSAGIVLLLLARKMGARAFLALGIFLLAVFLAVSPWLAKNYAWTGNPVYPLLHNVFDGGAWSAAQDASWSREHSPANISLAALWPRFWEFLAASEHADWLLFLFIPLALISGGRPRRATLALLAYAAAVYLLWFLFTQQIDRFLAPAIPALAICSGAGIAFAAAHRRDLTLGILLILLMVSPARRINYAFFHTATPLALGWQSADDFLGGPSSEFAAIYPLMQRLNSDKTPPDARVLFIGEARPYYCERQYLCATVFDRQPLEDLFRGAQSSEETFARFHERGITHVLFNGGELARLQHTYSYAINGEKRLGMLDGFDWRLFGNFAERHLRLVAYSGAERPGAWWRDWDKLRAWAVEQSDKHGGYPVMAGLYELAERQP